MAAHERERAYRIFSDALDRDEPVRAAFVSEQCAGDTLLEREVMALLAAATPGTDATAALLGGPIAPVRDQVGEVYGQFRLVELLGVGGMGVVYRAERTDGVPQAVAVKLLRGEISARRSARFIREARLLARLDHPAIARLIDVGVREGEGWIALELVRGQPIDDYCAAHSLGQRERIQLLATVAGAVATAHRLLVVHRDLKPSNVLVNDEGQPKLIDFGIASGLSEAVEAPEAKDERQRSFTPHYAAPEQVRGEPVTVGTDVFGLGALAYRVLTGRAPYAEADSAMGYLVAITSGEVELPSRTAAAAGLDAREVRSLTGDLDAILCKALQRDPARRYASAQDLQVDLQRHLDGLPVSARPATLAYRGGKFVRRHALGVSAATLVLVAVIAGATFYALQQARLNEARIAAARRGEFLEHLLKSADPRTGRRDITVAELLDAAGHDLDRSLGKEPLAEASMLGLIAETNGALARFPEGLAASDRQLALLASSGGTDLEVARALIVRGELYRAFGHYPEGIAPLRRAVALLGPLRGVDDTKAAAFDELAETLTNIAQEKEAEGLFRRSIALYKSLPADQRSDMPTVMNNLAVLLGNQGRYQESADEARDALALLRKVLPADHPDLLTSEGTYAESLLNLHKPAEAETVLREMIGISTRVRGPEHPDTLVAEVQLGEVLSDLGRFREAGDILRPAATTLDRVHGPTSRYATGAWTDYAIAACSGEEGAGRTAGLEAAQRVATIRERTLATTDYHRPGAQAVIGLCLVRLKRYAEAEAPLVKATAELEASRGPAFYTTQLGYKALKELYSETGRKAEAERIAAKIAP